MTTIGTIAWTAPEILRHETYDEKCDVYSFGIVLWEMITHQIPFDNMNPMEAGIAVASQGLRPTIPTGCDENWKNLMTKCWSEDPKQRPSFLDILVLLKNISYTC
eukprot:TRINITY_DN11859_c0_g1_i1.p1 TRINITY_DN11859_c0_g1~~TRINITY_DN11859_c0_g1_i1.p1  ORF type:complete len:105 (+),score=33.08 TRINITY_DN11859_c0_g1_i1:128-442(+)